MPTLMMKWFLFLPLFLVAEIEDFFRPVLNKTENSKMKNIDFIYLINLDERPEKLKDSLEKLEPFDIFPCRFSAINGWKLPLDAIDELGVKYETWMASGGWWGTYYPVDGDRTPHHEAIGLPGRTYFCHCMSFGAIGCALSHASVLQDALDSGYETIWIIEDDIEIIQDPNRLSDLIEELDKQVGRDGWDVLFTDQDSKNRQGEYVPTYYYAWRPNFTPANNYRFGQRTDISPTFRKIGARYGSYSMILRRSGIRKILSFLKCYQLFLPYDMEYTQPANIRLFTVRNDVVSTVPDAPSDNGAKRYMQKNGE